MKNLIINADDFGFTHSVNEGIIAAFRGGIVTSTTLMANGGAFEDAVALAQANPSLGVGCHLALVGGRPVAAGASRLVDDQGRLPKTLSHLTAQLVKKRIRPADIEREFAAQIERLQKAGLTPTHLDTHKHTAVHPTVAAAMARVARDFNIARVRRPFENIVAAPGAAARANRRLYVKQRLAALITLAGAAAFRASLRKHRLRTPDYFAGVTLTGLLDDEAIANLLLALPEGTTELMCHPSRYDADIENAPTRLKRQREREFQSLTNDRLREIAGEQNIRLISYAEL